MQLSTVALVAACSLLGVEGGLVVKSFSKYPGYAGTLNVQGVARLGQVQSSQVSLWYHLHGADPLCIGAGNGKPNSCGVHIHSGACSTPPGGHFFNAAPDPWATVVYTSGKEGVNQVVNSGKTQKMHPGNSLVVHDVDGARIACGNLEVDVQTAGTQQAAARHFTKYPGYLGPLEVSGAVTIYQVPSVYDSSVPAAVLDYDIQGVDTTCLTTGVGSAPNSCGIHVHSGPCSNAGGHYFGGPTDPWSQVVYFSDVAGNTGASIAVQVQVNETVASMEDRSLVVHDFSGARVACATIVQEAADFDPSQCDKTYIWDIRDVIVDFKRPTVDLGGKAARKKPFEIPQANRRMAILVNDTYPGPVVEAIEGELVCVKVVNNMLSEAISIHWHGLHMVGFPSMDGVYGVTQAGISAQGGSFWYRFRGNAGTAMYHAHMQAQQMDRGLKGPIIIHPKIDPHKNLYQEERLVILSDEWPNPGECLRAEGAQPGNPVCAEIDKASWNGQWGDGSGEYPWPMITVQQGKCYRMRFIAMMGQAQNFLMTMAGHNMTLIAVDGADVEPITLSMFNLHAGERADIVVCANQAPGNYLIQATYDLACFLETAPAPHMPRVDSCNFWSFLNYEGHTEKPSQASKKLLGGYKPPAGTGGGATPAPVAGPEWNTNLQSAWTMVKNLNPVDEPEKADVRFVFDVGVVGPNFDNATQPYGTADRMYMFTEHRSWKKPATPLLHTKGQCGADGVPFITIENDTTVEIVINNLSPTAHVLHMHGMRFTVVNYAPFSESWCGPSHFECFFLPLKVAKALDCSTAREGDPGTKFPYDAYWGCPYDDATDLKSQNLKNPLQKDMVSLWRRSWAVIRFKATNPGTWLFHCHMEQHIPTGQAMAFNIRPQDHPPVPKDVPTEGPCPVWSQGAEATGATRPPKPANWI